MEKSMLEKIKEMNLKEGDPIEIKVIGDKEPKTGYYDFISVPEYGYIGKDIGKYKLMYSTPESVHYLRLSEIENISILSSKDKALSKFLISQIVPDELLGTIKNVIPHKFFPINSNQYSTLMNRN